MKKGLTIFTPTFNREHTLSRLYESLTKQKCQNFEWLIVDDGSTDNTKKIIDKFIKENKIEIRYIYQSNHGKTYAHNIGVQNANYNMFYCVDSDDYIGDNTIEEINRINDKIYNDDKIIGMMGYKKNILKNETSINVIKCETLTVSELYIKYHFKDEIALIYKTKILKDHLFPIIEGEKFIPEGYLYDKLDNIGKCYFINKCIYYYEYQKDGYTNNSAKLLKNNIKGYLLYSSQKMEISKLWRNRLRGAISYNIGNFVLKNRFKHLKNKKYIILLLTYIPAYIYYKRKYEY